MNELPWQSFYKGDFQAVYALLFVPTAFLLYRSVRRPDAARAAVPDAARFVSAMTLVFAVETLVDPIATGPFLRLANLGDSPAASLIPFLFVYLGDFRVLLLAIGVARIDRGLRDNILRAAIWTLVVPVFAGAGFAFARWTDPGAHDQILWMLYEFGFLMLCLGFRGFWVPGVSAGEPGKAAFLRSIFTYSAAYYFLWLSADALIVFAGLDAGWALRVVPNQLYYAFWVPFVYWQFFSGRSQPWPNPRRHP